MAAITAGPGIALTELGNTFISVWRRQATLQTLKLVREVQGRFIAANPGGIGVVTVMEPVSVRPLNGEERAAAAAIARDFAPSTLASAYVFEGQGFIPAMSRAAVAGVLLLSRVKYPNRVFATVDDGARWLAQKLPPLDVPALARCIEEARARIG